MANSSAQRLFSPTPVLALVALTLIPLGSYTFFARSVLQCALAGVFLASLARYAIARDASDATFAVMEGTPPLAIIALPGVAIIQTALQFATGFSTGPALAMTEATMMTVALTLFYLLCRCAASGAADVQRLLVGLIVIGTLEALYGVLNLLSGNEYLLFYKRAYFMESATGTLVTRSHFAYLMELMIPVAFAMLAIEARRARIYRATDSTARVVSVATALVVMLLGIVFSRSRMGIASIMAAAPLVLLAARWLRPSHEHFEPAAEGGRRNFTVGVVAAVAVAFAAFIGVEAVVERFGNIEHDFEAGRLQAWKATWAMFMDRPIFGHGWGTFQELAIGYQPRPTGQFYPHAHNEYLQVMAEAGIIGFAIVAALVGLFFKNLTALLSKPLDEDQRAMAIALGIGITSVLLHSIADFGLRIPGVALTFVAVIAVFSRAIEDPKLLAVEMEEPRRRRRKRRRRSPAESENSRSSTQRNRHQ